MTLLQSRHYRKKQRIDKRKKAHARWRKNHPSKRVLAEREEKDDAENN